MPNTYTNLLYHVVFSTKLRLPVIDISIKEELHRYIGGIIRAEEGMPVAIGGIADHVHLLFKLKPAVPLADLMRVVKTNSSRWLNRSHRSIKKFGWQDGYAAFTVSESQQNRVAIYIRDQERHHRSATFKQELLALLRRNKIDYDEQYLWD